jgi:hypothetical protein
MKTQDSVGTSNVQPRVRAKATSTPNIHTCEGLRRGLHVPAAVGHREFVGSNPPAPLVADCSIASEWELHGYQA